MSNNQEQIKVIKTLAESLNTKEEINPVDVHLAWKNRNMEVRTKADVFFLLSCLNLLNSAIKEKQFKSSIHYSGIKSNVSRLVEFLLKTNNKNLVEDFWVNPSEGPCAYVVCFSFQFTFHHIPKSKSIIDYMVSSNNECKPWEGIRLQLIASSLFHFAQREKLKSAH